MDHFDEYWINKLKKISCNLLNILVARLKYLRFQTLNLRMAGLNSKYSR